MTNRTSSRPVGLVVDVPEDIVGPLRLFGEVLDESDHPVRGALVRLMPGNRVMSTDDAGAFAFEGIAARQYVLRAKLDDLYSGPVDVVVSEATSEALTVRVKRHGTAIVHVTGDGEPLVGANVTLGTDPDSDGIFTTATDSAGTAQLRGVRMRHFTAQVHATGWITQRIWGGNHDDPTGVLEFFVDLKHGVSVEGVVLDPESRPVAGARVTFSDRADSGGWTETVSRENGTWRVELAPSTYQVQAASKAFARGHRVCVEA